MTDTNSSISTISSVSSVFSVSSVPTDYDIIAQQIMDGTMEIYETAALNSKERSEVHETIKKYDAIESVSVSISGSPLKKITIKKKNALVEKTKFEPVVNSAMIRYFCDYMKVPFPVFSEKYVDYYLDVLDKYYDCKAKWKIYLDELEKNSLGSIKNEVNSVYAKVIDYVKSHEEYKEFIAKQHTIPDISMGNELYSVVNKDKTFVSIDVRSANYRVLKTYCPILCENLEWTDFIRKFTDNEFIINSKYAREVLFGKLGCKPIGKMPIIFIDNVIKHVDTKYSSYLKKMRCSNDEIVYEVISDKINEFVPLIDEFRARVNELDNKCYRVDVFKLKQLGTRAFFVKELIGSDKVEFKAVPKKFSVQSVKFYEGKPITDLDKKFTDEMELIATYDSSVFDA